MTHIAFLLTAQAWNERRLFVRQAPALAAAGHRVSVICIEPDVEYQLPERMEFVPLARSERKRARMTACRNIRSVIRRLRPDALTITCMEQLWLGFWIKKNLPETRVIYDCREDHPSTVRYHKEGIPKPLRRFAGSFISYWERKGDRVFDGLVGSDPAILELHDGMPADRKTLFLNVPQKELFAGPFPDAERRDFDLAILGSMSVRVGVDYVVEAMGRLKREHGLRLSLLLIGRRLDQDARLKRAIDLHVQEYELSNQIKEAGYVDHVEVPAILSQARIGLAPHHDFPKFRRNIACKCFEYMACGMPVVCSDLPPQRLFVRNGKNGFLYPPGDANALAETLLRLKRDPAMLNRLGSQARADFEAHWNCERETAQLVNFYDRIVGADPR